MSYIYIIHTHSAQMSSSDTNEFITFLQLIGQLSSTQEVDAFSSPPQSSTATAATTITSPQPQSTSLFGLLASGSDHFVFFDDSPWINLTPAASAAPVTANEIVCAKCNNEIDILPQVTLHCNCAYHLSCFNPKKTHCICGDKIHKKTDNDYEVCSICLQPMKKDLFRSVCKHRFHVKCINNWQTSGQWNNYKCPVCRRQIL